jgi:hypothetical protein
MPNPDEKSSRKRAAAAPSRKDAQLLLLQEEGAAHPYRNISDLHTCRESYKCALKNECISCAYKIAAFDIALDSEFTQSVPNVRPEMCPRINRNTAGSAGSGNCIPNGGITEDGIAYGYQKGMNILTVGDGDFSFSLALARIIMHKHKHDDIKSSYLVATSYESHDTLKRVYPDIDYTIEQLLKLNVQVCYEVDATNLSKTLPPHVQSQSHCQSQTKTSSLQSSSSSPFHRIIWNFPCTAIQNGQDGQNQQMHENQMLVKKFVKGCQSFICPLNGEIQFMHKTKPPYDQWELERIAVEVVPEEQIWDTASVDAAKSDSIPDADPCPFEYKGRVVFDRCLLLPYVPRKALDKKSFPCHDACLFVFGLKDRIGRTCGEAHGMNSKQEIGFAPTIPDREHDQYNVDDHDHANNDAKDETQSQVLPVTFDIIDEIRFMHLSLGSCKDRKKRKVVRR